ncbi:MAG TPA: amino acid ABC transporter permease [Bordetella sp.]
MRPFGFSEFLFIVEAVRWTVLLSLVAFVGGAVVGLPVALARTAPPRWLRVCATVYIQLLMGTPLLMQLFLMYFGPPALLGVEVDAWVAAAIALTLNSAAFLAEIWRGCIQAVPQGQVQAARALGLRYPSLMRCVVLPQAFRISLPATVGFLVQLVKATSLASIIGFVEVTRAGQIINNATFRPAMVFGIVAIIYFVLCWPMSRYAAALERRYSAAQAR